MNILFLSQFFTPEPFFKALPFAKGLARRGHHVEVLTGFPNYPGGKLYPGYRVRAWQVEELDGIRITRLPIYPSHDRSVLRRCLNYSSFALSASMLGPFFAGRPDAVYVYHPPITTGLAACTLRLLKGTPFVYDIQDLWPDTITSTFSGDWSPSLLGALARVCSLVYRQAAHLTVVSPGFRRTLIERGVAADKITVMYNWCDEDSIYPAARDEDLARRLGLSGQFNIMFAGNMGLAQSLDTVLQAAQLCSDRDPRIQFVLVGGGIERERLEATARGLALPNVRFLPQQPMEEMAPLLALADVLLVHLKDDPLFRITIPSKTQTVLAAAKPALMALTGDAAALVERAQAGIVIPPENPREMAEAALTMARMNPAHLQEMGRRGRAFYLRELSMEAGIERFERLFQAVAGHTPRTARSNAVSL